MTGLNKAMLIGHLGRDPEIRRTQSGAPVATLSVATSETWRDKATGERKEKTEWHRVVIFNEGLCKIAEQHLKKGAKVFVEGQIATRKWTDQAGAEKYTTEIVLKAFGGQIVLLDRAERAPSPDEEAYGAAPGGPASPLDDEIPF